MKTLYENPNWGKRVIHLKQISNREEHQREKAVFLMLETEINGKRIPRFFWFPKALVNDLVSTKDYKVLNIPYEKKDGKKSSFTRSHYDNETNKFYATDDEISGEDLDLTMLWVKNEKEILQKEQDLRDQREEALAKAEHPALAEQIEASAKLAREAFYGQSDDNNDAVHQH